MTILVIIAALFSFSGCGYFLGPKSVSKPVVIASDTCLNNAGVNVKSWLTGGSPAIEPMIDCVLKSVDRFNERTSGSTSRDRWSRGELATFFKTYFSDSQSDQAAWIEETLRLKQALFGGQAESISQAELGRIRALALKLKPELGGLGGQLDLMLYRAQKPDPAKAFELSLKMRRIAGLIADEVRKSDPNRPATSLGALFTSARRLGVNVSDLDSWLPLFQSIKSLTSGGSHETVAPKEWPGLIVSSVELWTLTLRWKYFNNEDYDILGQDFPLLDKTAQEALDLLTQMVIAQDSNTLNTSASANVTGGVGSDQLVTLINQLGSKNLLPFGLKALTVEAYLPGILGKILYGNSHPDQAEVAKVFGKPQLATIRYAIEDWLVSQRDIIATYENRTGIAPSDLVRELTATVQTRLSTVHRVIRPVKLNHSPMNLIQLLSEGQPLVHDADGRVIVAARDQLPAWTRHDVDLFNAIRAGFAPLIRGYAHDPIASQSLKGLTDTETEELYKDARDAGHDFGLVDVRNTTAGARTFLEATLFTSVANGVPLFTLHEAIEWLELASSASLNGAKGYESLEPSCEIQAVDAKILGVNPIDVFGQIKLYPGCFREAFSKSIFDFTPNLPGFLAWYKKNLTPQLAGDVEKAGEEGGRAAGYSSGLVDSSDMRSILPIFQYAENLFAIYDINKNDVLDQSELWTAFPVFREMIRTRANGMAEDLETQKAIFAYLVYYGSEPPTQSYLDEGFFFTWEKTYQSLVTLTANRLQVLKIIANFNLSALKSQQAGILDFYTVRKANLRASIAGNNPSDIAEITNLMRCQPSAVTGISDLLRTHLNEVTPSGPKDKTDFSLYIDHLKQLVAGDRRFDKVCLPF